MAAPATDQAAAAVGRRIRALREQRGWSQVDLAGRLDVHQSTVSHWQAGRRLDLADLLALAAVFDVPPARLFVDPPARKQATDANLSVYCHVTDGQTEFTQDLGVVQIDWDASREVVGVEVLNVDTVMVGGYPAGPVVRQVVPVPARKVVTIPGTRVSVSHEGDRPLRVRVLEDGAIALQQPEARWSTSTSEGE